MNVLINYNQSRNQNRNHNLNQIHISDSYSHSCIQLLNKSRNHLLVLKENNTYIIKWKTPLPNQGFIPLISFSH